MSNRPQTTEELIALLERECELRRQNVHLARLGSILLVLTILGMAAFAWLKNGSFPSDMLSSLSPFFLVALGGVALTANHRKALLEADAFADPRLTGYLIEALSYRDPQVVRDAERKLSEVLRPSESLEAMHRRILSDRLVFSKNQAFIGSALGVLRGCGESESIPGVEATATRGDRLGVKALEALGDIRHRIAQGIIEGSHEESALHLRTVAENRGIEATERVQPHP